jgi:hypothetical protein
MFVKLFYFLALFGYLNIIAYQASCNSVENKHAIFDGDSLIEFVLNDLLDIPLKKQSPDAEVTFKKYSISYWVIFLLPIIILLATYFFGQRFVVVKKLSHPIYKAKSLCLPGYYSFLFRYKPF